MDWGDCNYDNLRKKSCLLQAIANIRLFDHHTDSTDGLDDIFQQLRDPVDLVWVPWARKNLRRIRLLPVSLHQRKRSDDSAYLKTSAVRRIRQEDDI